MSAAAPLQNTAAKSPLVSKLSHAGLLLQRKCACGGPASSLLSGECEECNKNRLQKKLSIGASNDPMEQEADRVADLVLAAPAHSAVSGAIPSIQRFTGQSTGDRGAAPPSVDRVLASSGRPLDPAIQQDMGQRFGHDFSRVRVHTGAAAEQSACDVNAHAYTAGDNIVFGSGRFAPGTHDGRRLLAHELTHVVQQNHGMHAQSIQRDTPPATVGTITSQTVATSPGGRTRTTIGVGEEVDLIHSLGSTTWATTGGTLTYVSGNPGPLVRLTAPDTGQFVTVTAGRTLILLTVIPPRGVHMDRFGSTGVKHTLNQPDSGIETLPFLLPDSVNFYNARYRELDAAGVATAGVYSCNPASGGHCGAGGGGAPCPDKALTNTVVVGKGTQSLIRDCVYSGHCGTAAPFAPGSLTITIPYEYKVGTSAFHAITNVAQVHALASDASTLTSSKGGASGQTTVASPTLTNPASGGLQCS